MKKTSAPSMQEIRSGLSARRSRLLFPLVLLLASLACAVPFVNRITPTAAPPVSTLVATTQPTVTQSAPDVVAPRAAATPTVNLPPALVEVEPQPGSEVGPGAAPVFYFNQPMQRASVEGAFQQAGRFEWLNDATVKFTPAQPAKTGAPLDVTISTGAKAANGLPLAAPVSVGYLAAGPLEVADRLPKPDAKDVNPSSAVVVTFNRPVVALGGDPQQMPAGFSLEPAAQGRAEWLNTSTYIFYPQPALMGGAGYTVRLNSSLVSAEGGALAPGAPSQWSFSTSAPAILSVKPTNEHPVLLDTSFTLTFNQPMDKASVESSFSVAKTGASPVAGKFTWNDMATEMTFQPGALLERSANYSLVLQGSARSLGGATTGRDFVSVLATVPQFAVTQTRPGAGETLAAYSGYGTVTITFSSPVATGQDLEKLIAFNPRPVTPFVTRDPDGSQVFISAFFQPTVNYTVTIASELRDRWGATLGMPFTFTFSSQPATPALVIPVRQVGAQAIFIPQNETVLPARATNLTKLTLKRGSLAVSDFIRTEQDYQGLQNWQPLVKAEWSVPLQQKPNTNEAIDIPLSTDQTPLDPGLYFLKIETQPETDPNGQTPPALLVVSPIQVVLKNSARQAFVWAVRVVDNSPVANSKVSIYDSSAAVIGSCITDPSGKCQVDLPVREDLYKPIFAVLGQPGQDDFSLAASDWSMGVAPSEFLLSYETRDTQPAVYLYTDRPIYRPGQAVSFRVIARSQDNGRYAPPPMKQLTIDVVSPYDPVSNQTQVLASLPLALDAYGSASGVYTLPDDAPPGNYILRVQEVKFQEIGFEVAQYRKPEIDLQVKFAQADALAGKDLQAQVTARYFFGAPAGNLAARWTLFRSVDRLDVPGDFSVGLVDTSWLQAFPMGFAADLYVADGQAQIGPDGTLTLSFSGADLREKLGTAVSQTNRLKLEVTVTDESGLPVSARAAMRLHPAQFYIGARSEVWSGEVNKEITYDVHTVDWQAAPVGDKPLTAHFRKVVYKHQEGTDPFNPPLYVPEYTEIGSADFRTSAQGDARLAFTPHEPGTYSLDITSTADSVTADSPQAMTQLITWVGGPGAAPWPNLPNQRILLRSNAKSYKPGDTARIFIPNPFPDGALALITIERSKVMQSSVVTLKGSSYDLQLPVNNDYAPNIYVSVVIIGHTNGRPDFRMGYAELSVDPAAELLKVDVQASPAKPQPGGDVTLNIRVKDVDGKPVQGQFSLALIDKAVLALADPNTQPIVDAFYGLQPLGVQNSLSLATYAGRFVYGQPGRGGGGAGGEAQLAPSVRSKFADTAYWNGKIETDVTGTAQLTVKLPDNLTTWRADVRGLTSDTRVGQAAIDLVVGKPLLVSPVAPRFAVAGDHLELAAVVFNNTQDALHAGVRLEGSGFSLDDPNAAVQPVDLKAGERKRISWWSTVQDVPSLDLTFSAETDTQPNGAVLRDAARPENNPIPVLHYASPQTFGTAGMLPEAGEKVELVSLPRSFTPTGGELRVELSPSLTAVVLDGLKAQEAYPHDFTEPVLSRLLPNLAAAQAFRDLKLDNPTLQATLSSAIVDSADRLVRLQNQDGGWGWAAGNPSDPYISAYALLGLSRAAQSGVLVDPQVLQKSQQYLAGTLLAPSAQVEAWRMDRLAFQFFALQQSGYTDFDPAPLYGFRDKLSPWGKAFLAMAMSGKDPGDGRAKTMLSDLQSSASRSATGASWQDSSPTWHNWSTPNFTTAVVAYAIARADPTSQVLVDAVRYLVLNRHPDGGWSSSYESAWVIMALVETVRGTGDLQASYAFRSTLNDTPVLDGKVGTAAQAANPQMTTIPLSSLRASQPNPLKIAREAGAGRLYYRAFLQVNRPAQEAEAIQRGLSIQRQYYLAGQDCRKQACQPLQGIDLANPIPVQVRLTLTVPEDMYYVVVEDAIPAGAEVLNPRLKTSQQNIAPGTDQQAPQFDPNNPFDQGWGWWLFRDPQAYDDHIRWVVNFLPAGTYELTYRLTPFLAGEFRVLPAHAWQYYFPDVEGTSKGEVLKIH